MYRLDSPEIFVLRLLSNGRRRATFENAKIVLEDGTEVPQRAIGHLCNARPPLVKGAIRFSSDGSGVVGYLYEITAAGRQALKRAERAAGPAIRHGRCGTRAEG